MRIFVFSVTPATYNFAQKSGAVGYHYNGQFFSVPFQVKREGISTMVAIDNTYSLPKKLFRVIKQQARSSAY